MRPVGSEIFVEDLNAIKYRITYTIDSDFCFDSPDAVIDPWLSKLWGKILKIIPLPTNKEIISSSIK